MIPVASNRLSRSACGSTVTARTVADSHRDLLESQRRRGDFGLSFVRSVLNCSISAGLRSLATINACAATRARLRSTSMVKTPRQRRSRCDSPTAHRRRTTCPFGQISATRYSPLAAPWPATEWRRGWDSNPRGACAPAGFQDQCIRPLCHPSGAGAFSNQGDDLSSMLHWEVPAVPIRLQRRGRRVGKWLTQLADRAYRVITGA
jgi:hypothetical protein